MTLYCYEDNEIKSIILINQVFSLFCYSEISVIFKSRFRAEKPRNNKNRVFQKYLEYDHEFPLHFPLSLEILNHFMDRSSFELFEFFGDLTTDDDRSISTKISLEFSERPLYTMYRLIDYHRVFFVHE